MFSKLKINNKGFTIVETLIVLAIAAVIIIIVLLAVPALQRTSRNTNIKTNATTLGGGFNEYESNNEGSLPQGVTCATGTCTITGAGTQTATASISSGDTVSFVPVASAAATTVKYSTGTTCNSGSDAACASVQPGYILVMFGDACPTGAPTGTTLKSVLNPQTIAIFYPIEASVNGVGCLQD